MGDRIVALKLLVSLLICYGASALGGLATSTSVKGWYLGIAKPSWNPPAWVFGPVWFCLFTMMGISLWMIWKHDNPNKKKAMVLFGVQLVLNVLWSCFFFGLKNPGLACVEIVFLIAAIALTLLSFAKIDKMAGMLLLPYLVWTTFAAFLNGTIWILNS